MSTQGRRCSGLRFVRSTTTDAPDARAARQAASHLGRDLSSSWHTTTHRGTPPGDKVPAALLLRRARSLAQVLFPLPTSPTKTRTIGVVGAEDKGEEEEDDNNDDDEDDDEEEEEEEDEEGSTGTAARTAAAIASSGKGKGSEPLLPTPAWPASSPLLPPPDAPNPKHSSGVINRRPAAAAKALSESAWSPGRPAASPQ